MILKSVSKNGYTFATVYSSKCVTVFFETDFTSNFKLLEFGNNILLTIYK